MRTPTLALLALLAAGCGASMTELVAEERWYDACDSFDRDDALYTEKSEYLMGELAAKARADVVVHVFSVEELGALLPHVPARMATGEVVLMVTEAHYEAGDFWHLSFTTRPISAESSGRKFSCCEPGEWMDLDGRAQEWEQIREANRAAERQARERAERYAGPLGMLRAMGEMFAGAAADLTLIGTLGAIDIDVSDLPLAMVSGIQAMRAIGDAVLESVRRDMSARADDEEASLAQRRAESLAILAHLVTDLDRCVLGETANACRVVGLYALPPGQEVTAVETRSIGMVMNDERDPCDIEVTTEMSREQAEVSQPLAAVLPQSSLAP